MLRPHVPRESPLAPKSPLSYARVNLFEAVRTLILQGTLQCSSITLWDCQTAFNFLSWTNFSSRSELKHFCRGPNTADDKLWTVFNSEFCAIHSTHLSLRLSCPSRLGFFCPECQRTLLSLGDGAREVTVHRLCILCSLSDTAWALILLPGHLRPGGGGGVVSSVDS